MLGQASVSRTPKEVQRAAKAFDRRHWGPENGRSAQRVTRDYAHLVHAQFSAPKGNTDRDPEQPCTIYRVPPEILAAEQEAHKPMAVSIGPYFHHSINDGSKLKQLEDYKWRCARRLMTNACSAASAGRNTVTEENLVRACFLRMKELDRQVRASYSEKISASDDSLVMMMLDGCFILHLLLKNDAGAEQQVQGDNMDHVVDDSGGAVNGGGGGGVNDDWTQVIGRCWIWNLVKYDLLLLHNQIPFFVIRELYKLQIVNDEDSEKKLISYGIQLFSTIYPLRKDAKLNVTCEQVHHLLHLVYLSILPPDNPPGSPPKQQNVIAETAQQQSLPLEVLPLWIPSAKELKESGVKFRKKKNSNVFLEITFQGGVLEIPELKIFDYSNILFRNLIAFEQCYTATRGHVTCYADFMGCLLTTQEEARVLHLKGILINGTAKLEYGNGFFSQINSGAHYSSDRNYLRGLTEDIMKHHGKRHNRWGAILRRNYCTNPWVITSVLTAVFLLLLAVTNTILALLNRFKR